MTGKQLRNVLAIALAGSQFWHGANANAERPYTQPGMDVPTYIDPDHPENGPLPRPNGAFAPPAAPLTPQRPAGWPGGQLSADDPRMQLKQGLPPAVNQYPNTGLPAPVVGVPIPGAPPVGPLSPLGGNMLDASRVASRTGGASVAGPALSAPQPFTSGQIAARVGDEIIIVGDVLQLINDVLAKSGVKLTPEQLVQQQQMAMPRALQQMIESKLIYADAKKSIPAANFPKFEEKITEQFEKTALKKLLKDENAENEQDLNAKLKAKGTSLDLQKKLFAERTIASQWVRTQINVDKEVPYSQIVEYYHKHAADYKIPAKAKWEEITADAAKFDSRAEAYQAITAWGNDVLRGVPLADVAKAHSHGSTASEGGLHDWTTRDSLASKVMDDAIFSLPIGRMSQVLEDERGLHIVRVIDRQDAGQTPFSDAQVEIRKKIKDDNYKSQVKEYLAKVREKTPVWTMYDSQGGLTKMLGKTGDE